MIIIMMTTGELPNLALTIPRQLVVSSLLAAISSRELDLQRKMSRQTNTQEAYNKHLELNYRPRVWCSLFSRITIT